MMRFAGNLFCRIFRLEIALVLTHASQWSEVTGIGLQVSAFDNPELEPEPLHVGGLTVQLDTNSRRASDARELHGYLMRNLSPAYNVALAGQRIVVDWDARRRPATITPAFQNPASPA